MKQPFHKLILDMFYVMLEILIGIVILYVLIDKAYIYLGL